MAVGFLPFSRLRAPSLPRGGMAAFLWLRWLGRCVPYASKWGKKSMIETTGWQPLESFAAWHAEVGRGHLQVAYEVAEFRGDLCMWRDMRLAPWGLGVGRALDPPSIAELRLGPATHWREVLM
jgi:hypothetical protein